MSYGNGDGELEGYPLGEALVSEIGTDVGAYNLIIGQNNYVKLDRCPLGNYLGPVSGTVEGSSYGRYSNIFSGGNGDRKHEGS